MKSHPDDGTTSAGSSAPSPRFVLQEQEQDARGALVPDTDPIADGWAHAFSLSQSAWTLAPARTPSGDRTAPVSSYPDEPPEPPYADVPPTPPTASGSSAADAPADADAEPSYAESIPSDPAVADPTPKDDPDPAVPSPSATNTSPTGDGKADEQDDASDPAPQGDPPFILYKSGDEFGAAIADLTVWVHGLLLPVYGREISSTAPWCTRWWDHFEAVAQLYGLWMAWQEMTGKDAPLSGPATWHRDFLTPVMSSLRDPRGPFAGCKPGQHREKELPPIEEL
ncbi:DUF4913 domain-containing protein [Streptomyces sp. NPDC013172]|uniref:DUF4913 domain-containing protein n=1 Tax=unclassified Streptomyces TaxID=2593676 RepID=UPI00340FF4AC